MIDFRGRIFHFGIKIALNVRLNNVITAFRAKNIHFLSVQYTCLHLPFELLCSDTMTADGGAW